MPVLMVNRAVLSHCRCLCPHPLLYPRFHDFHDVLYVLLLAHCSDLKNYSFYGVVRNYSNPCNHSRADIIWKTGHLCLHEGFLQWINNRTKSHGYTRWKPNDFLEAGSPSSSTKTVKLWYSKHPKVRPLLY